MIITALDTETTGLDPSKHEIIQLGLIELNIDDTGEIHTLQKHEYNIAPKNIHTANEEALRINGYSSSKWLDSKPFGEYFSLLERIFASSECLIGQNLIFDLRFIAKEYKLADRILPKIPKYIDTKFMGIQLVNEGVIKSSSMDSMCAHFDIKFKGRAHTALTDCERTVTLWEHLMKYTDVEYFSYEEPYDPYAKANLNARKTF